MSFVPLWIAKGCLKKSVFTTETHSVAWKATSQKTDIYSSIDTMKLPLGKLNLLCNHTLYYGVFSANLSFLSWLRGSVLVRLKWMGPHGSSDDIK